MEHKHIITEKFIELLPFEGWNSQALEKSTKECGFESSYMNVIYAGGIIEFTNDFIMNCNNLALEKAKEAGLGKLRTTQKVEEIIFQRILTYNIVLGGVDNVRKFAGYCATPLNMPASLRNIYGFSGDVWDLLGDKSTDISYYTKRLSLSAIYTKSFLYSLSDKSNKLEQTRKFIQKSIDGLMKINKLKQKINDFISYSKLNTKRK